MLNRPTHLQLSVIQHSRRRPSARSFTRVPHSPKVSMPNHPQALTLSRLEKPRWRLLARSMTPSLPIGWMSKLWTFGGRSLANSIRPESGMKRAPEPAGCGRRRVCPRANAPAMPRTARRMSREHAAVRWRSQTEPH